MRSAPAWARHSAPYARKGPGNKQGQTNPNSYSTRCCRGRTIMYTSSKNLVPFSATCLARKDSGFHFKLERQSMTLSTANMWFPDILPGFFTICLYLYTPHERSGEWTDNLRMQSHEFACVCLADPRYRACTAKITGPVLSCRLEESAFFHTATSKVVAVEMRAFFSCGSFHNLNYRTIF